MKRSRKPKNLGGKATGRKAIRNKVRAGEVSAKAKQAEQQAKHASDAAHYLHERADLAHRQAEESHRRAKLLHSKRQDIKVGALKKRKGSRASGNGPNGRSAQGSPAKTAILTKGPRSTVPFTVAGIGASAGGYEAIVEFLTHVPKDTGMAFVVVQHLDPHHESQLSELLCRSTEMPVREIKSGVRIEPNTVYVLPSNAGVTISGAYLRLRVRQPTPIPMPIDVLFRSLAEEQENRAIGILLSGMGTDGSLGIEEIKGHGGITFAQDKGSAKFFAMPGSAIGSGSVDFVLPPSQIAQELGRLARHPYVAPGRSGEAHPPVDDVLPGENLFSGSPDALRELFTLLRTRTGVDFSLYKPGTLNRRIMRRMVLRRVETVEVYVRLLHEQPDELDGLFNDLLISVTGFFRDPQTFEVLRRRLLPKLIKAGKGDPPLRIWSCGCSTGEEAYSLAITAAEVMQKLGKHAQVQIFASDLNERGIEKARAGIYHENILLDVSPERLRRYFVKVDGHYQVAKPIRDMCVFARQNVTTDPPFSNLDLISCRNVLIYLTPVLQRRIFPVFHYALKNGGFLVLGGSEGIGEHSELFALADRKHKIYTKKVAAYRAAVDFRSHSLLPPGRSQKRAQREEAPAPVEVDVAVLQQKVDRLLLTQFTPAGVVINSKMDALQFRGKTGPYLEHQAGMASLNLLKMVHEDLALDLRRAVRKAIQTAEAVEQAGVELRSHGVVRNVKLEVHPLQIRSSGDRERFYLVLFQEQTVPQSKETRREPGRKAETRQLVRLKEELAATKESLQAIIEEQEATNEELKSANEEVQSSNEELQSTNEELETAREELQSTNEELTTLNQELQNRNNELGQLNNDLTNLLSSVNIAIVMLGTDFKIRRFTPLAEKIFNLIPSDVGRRLGDLNRNVNIPDLEEAIMQVMDHLNVVEREVQDRSGRWYSLRIRPYRTHESVIDGVVLMLFDIEELKRSIRQIVSLVRHPVILLHGDLRVNRANQAFCAAFGVQEDEIEEKIFYEMAGKQWDFKAMHELLDEVLPRQGEVEAYRIVHEFPGVGGKRLLVNARRFYEESRGVQFVFLSFEEITGSEGAK